MKSQDYKASVNGYFDFDDLQLDSFDVIPSGPRTFHILRDNRSFHAEVISADYEKKELAIRVNGSRYDVRLADTYDQLVRKLGLAVGSAQVVKDIKAPMPGLVLQINVKPGDAVEKDSPLLILEAMKMENVLKAPGSGTVKKVAVNKGQAVEKNQLLIEME